MPAEVTHRDSRLATRKAAELRHFPDLPYAEDSEQARSWAAEFAREEKDEKTASTEAVRGGIDSAQDPKKEIPVRMVLTPNTLAGSSRPELSSTGYHKRMQLEDIGEVIAERVLKRSFNGEEPTDLIVRLGRPRPFDDHSGYLCPFEILGLSERKVRYAGGVDAIQSLQLVFQMISALLHHYKREPSVELHWLAAGDDLGFPEGR